MWQQINLRRLMNSPDSRTTAIWVLDEGAPFITVDDQFWGMYDNMLTLYHALC